MFDMYSRSGLAFEILVYPLLLSYGVTKVKYFVSLEEAKFSWTNFRMSRVVLQILSITMVDSKVSQVFFDRGSCCSVQQVSESAVPTSSADSNGALHSYTQTQELPPGSGSPSPQDNIFSDYKTQASDEPVFLEVIPEDLVTIHPDPSQTVGLFDGQQPLPVVEQAQREADVEVAKEWDWWPSGLQEDQIKIKPDVQGKYGREMAAAIQAVQLACMLSQRVQERLLRNEEKAEKKKDKSLITVAGT